MLQCNGKFIAFFLSFVAVINWKAVKCSNILSHFQWFDYAALDRLFQWPQIRLHTRECWLHHHLPHMPFYCLLPKIHKSGILNPKENVVPLWGHDLYLIARDKHRIQFFPFFFFSIFFRIFFYSQHWLNRGSNSGTLQVLFWIIQKAYMLVHLQYGDINISPTKTWFLAFEWISLWYNRQGRCLSSFLFHLLSYRQIQFNRAFPNTREI